MLCSAYITSSDKKQQSIKLFRTLVTFTIYTESSVDVQSGRIVSAESDRFSLSARIQNPSSIITNSHFGQTFLLFMEFLLGTSNLLLIGFLSISFLTLILLKVVYTFGHLLNAPAEYYHGSKQ